MTNPNGADQAETASHWSPAESGNSPIARRASSAMTGGVASRSRKAGSPRSLGQARGRSSRNSSASKASAPLATPVMFQALKANTTSSQPAHAVGAGSRGIGGSPRVASSVSVSAPGDGQAHGVEVGVGGRLDLIGSRRLAQGLGRQGGIQGVPRWPPPSAESSPTGTSGP